MISINGGLTCVFSGSEPTKERESISWVPTLLFERKHPIYRSDVESHWICPLSCSTVTTLQNKQRTPLIQQTRNEIALEHGIKFVGELLENYGSYSNYRCTVVTVVWSDILIPDIAFLQWHARSIYTLPHIVQFSSVRSNPNRRSNRPLRYFAWTWVLMDFPNKRSVRALATWALEYLSVIGGWINSRGRKIMQYVYIIHRCPSQDWALRACCGWNYWTRDYLIDVTMGMTLNCNANKFLYIGARRRTLIAVSLPEAFYEEMPRSIHSSWHHS